MMQILESILMVNKSQREREGFRSFPSSSGIHAEILLKVHFIQVMCGQYYSDRTSALPEILIYQQALRVLFFQILLEKYIGVVYFSKSLDKIRRRILYSGFELTKNLVCGYPIHYLVGNSEKKSLRRVVMADHLHSCCSM